ncbi:hypothetical protein M404DRAFT_1007972 [Pisolithus tinctorius Marx 270]|uniref:Uncharacterized protein n=1 Tax=Pisolithus tinctorius Marx 270 TaxID=870435 RepID=A0A0C3NGW3_PISTI|nr:hypothetical protein M404DRAFT_1007972 [Pisolithus tinctorius Marx 270]
MTEKFIDNIDVTSDFGVHSASRSGNTVRRSTGMDCLELLFGHHTSFIPLFFPLAELLRNFSVSL